MKKVQKLSDKGFTLIEMIIVLFVISIIMLLIIPNISKNKESIDTKGNEAFVTVVQTQLDLYTMNEGEAGLTDENTFSSLHKDNYLSKNQFDQAESMLTVTKGEVKLKDK